MGYFNVWESPGWHYLDRVFDGDTERVFSSSTVSVPSLLAEKIIGYLENEASEEEREWEIRFETNIDSNHRNLIQKILESYKQLRRQSESIADHVSRNPELRNKITREGMEINPALVLEYLREHPETVETYWNEYTDDKKTVAAREALQDPRGLVDTMKDIHPMRELARALKYRIAQIEDESQDKKRSNRFRKLDID